MKYLRSYLWEHRKLLLAIILLGAAAAVLLFLYDLPPAPVLYVFLVCGVLGLGLFAVPDYLAYVRRVKELELQKKTILAAADTFALLSEGAPLPEKELEETAQLLLTRLRELETTESARRRDMLEYYTLWVHQIKTPLSAMGLILQQMPTEEGAALQQELFKVERYVEMVLGYLRLDTMNADLRLESCGVHDVVSQAVKKFAPQFIYKKLNVDLKDFDNRVVTDEKWLLFVVEQLLSNAVKYTDKGGVIVSMNGDDVLTIADTGVGISPEDLPRVFERGFTGMNGRVDKTSTGLGLYLVKQVLNRLGSRIEIESAPGKGTEVRVYLHRGELKTF